LPNRIAGIGFLAAWPKSSSKGISSYISVISPFQQLRLKNENFLGCIRKSLAIILSSVGWRFQVPPGIRLSILDPDMHAL
jgi:hypothetical protein